MSVLVFAESQDSICKKAAFEAVTYGRKTANLIGSKCIALTIGSPNNASTLGKYGADEVKNIPSVAEFFDSKSYAKAIAEAFEQTGSTILILSQTSAGKALAGRLAIRLDAGLISGVTGIPDTTNGFQVSRSVFSGKAIVACQIRSEKKVLSLMSNSFPPEVIGADIEVTDLPIQLESSSYKLKEITKVEGAVPLPEAELVVSGGRGFKGPENWKILEELASSLGAATACSRPVSDSGWRPHHEHVGQTGTAIRPNLYVAIGISGAIQHLGGVNNSKTIVVINKDPEAPFFKAADYGVVGDLFEVIPRLTAAVKKIKG
jgi:electron transfer flavoprotein alpha subunit